MAEPPAQHSKGFVCVLKASIHCEGCKRKVKKILNQVQGVESVDVDTKQQKVTVTGTVDADTLIKKLAKSGKQAQLWPLQKPPKPDKNVAVVSNNKGKKTTNESQTTQIDQQQENPTAVKTNPKDSNHPPPPKPAKPPAAEHINGDGGVNGASSSSEASEVNSTTAAATAATAEETKKEGKKKDEEKCASAGELPQTAEKKEAAVEKSIDRKGSGNSGKKKKKNGQSGNHSTNNKPAAPPAAAPPLAAENRVPGPPPQTNQIPPYNPVPHYYDYYYSGPSGTAPGPLPQPAYAVSYNTACPTSSYTAAAYYSAPPNSYVYMHPGYEAQPRPLDPESNVQRQPLDSFEMFSEENPNGCYVM